MAGPASSVRLAPELGWWAYLEDGDSDMPPKSRLGIFLRFSKNYLKNYKPTRYCPHQNRQKVPSHAAL